ncbi:MAG: hypothetical protein EA370_17565 [Wenzhouxiangella sp.]|nr:MAG: hypothetical protein EA370_17565 [Wenzhouxiangella sp.]
MNAFRFAVAVALATWLWSDLACARPITYTGGQVLVAEAQADQWQARYTYSHSFRYSTSVGYLSMDDLRRTGELDLAYARLAWLARRWNQPNSQGNLFLWGGLGHARTDLGSGVGRHVGFQADWETRRIYTAAVSELHDGAGWRHRNDTVSLGLAPFEHDFERTAVWLVGKGMRTVGAVEDKPKAALVLRLFNPSWWLEAGVDSNGKPLAFFMINL